MSEVSSQTLHLVAKELGTTLNEARVALENFAEHGDNIDLLNQCANRLHEAYGVLRVVEVYGAALLAEEMEHSARYLIEAGGDERHRVDGLDALMRAMVQLPTYLERVLNGGRDLALVLLPLLNDLRAVRGNALLSEGTLLLLNLRSDQQAAPQPLQPGEPPLTVEQWARRLRTRYQMGLLGWIRGERPEQNLEIMGRVAERLEQIATTQPVFQLWWVVGAIVEGLRNGGLDGGASIKRLLGIADREMRRLYSQGEARYSDTPSLELLNNLLYYVARATNPGPRISAVRASFRLGDLLPVDNTIEQERERLSAPSVKLMRTVAAAIKEDLSRVKDVLDIFVRKGGAQLEELAPQLELLKKISDTLGVLGLGGLRASVQEEIAVLGDIVARKEPANEDSLVRMAATLISVEDALDDQLVKLILPQDGATTGSMPVTSEGVEDSEFRQVTEAVLRECIVNLARIKETVTHVIQKPEETQGVDAIPGLLRGITSGLLMLGKNRAVETIESISRHLQAVIRPGSGAPPADRLDRLADAIVSVEYYMETVQGGRADPWYMLDNADSCLKALADEPLPAPAVEADEPDAFARTLKIDGPAAAQTAAARAAAADSPEKHIQTHPVVEAPPSGDPDPEFLELFIEEAREEVTSIQTNFPAWEQNPHDADALVTLRRSFHTLKGSGRMVGAKLIGEFSWSIESLLNRVINKTLSRSPAIVAVLREAVAVLPELVEQLEVGRAATVDVPSIMERAHALAEGREAESAAAAAAAEPTMVETHVAAPAPQPVAPAVPVPRAAPPPPAAPKAEAPGPRLMDPQLHEIYSKETAGHLAVIRDYLKRCAGLAPPYEVPEAVYRACHTLSGSSKMAEARQGIKVAEPLNRYLRKVFDSGRGLDAAGLQVLGDAVTAMEEVVTHINETSGYFVGQPALIQRIDALDRKFDEEPVSDTTLDPSIIAPALQLSLAPEPASEAPADEEEGESFDVEVAAIFSEEATELLESADSALNAWNQERTNQQHVAELQRPLHTLKGGARMAGITAMGDLSHELETLVLQINSGLIAADDRSYEIVQASLDELSRMRDAVSSGRRVAPARALMERIRALGRPAAAPTAMPPAPAAAPAAPAVQPAIARPAPAAAVPAPTPAPVPKPTAPPPPIVQAKPVEPAAARVAPTPPPPPPPPAVPATAALEIEDEPLTESAPAAIPPGRDAPPLGDRPELARVDAELLDNMLNNAGEVSIFRSRLEQQISSIDFNLGELARTVTRLKEQLRKLEIETETQILARHHEESSRKDEFDPLELDRYSSIQQFSRALAESSSDVASLQGLLENLTREAQNLLMQQARVITELQNGLMRTRMVPFQRHVPRLSRLVRQTATDAGKRVELVVEGASGELDRQVLERMLPPFEHMLRNAVVHGLETPAARAAAGKAEQGRIQLSLRREGAEVVIDLADDGAGMNLRAIRDKAVKMGLVDPRQTLTDEQAMQLILEPGFSTAGQITQAAGRGVGMDVVATEVKKLGGALFIESQAGHGTKFTVRLPFTLAISQALIVRLNDEYYALPLPTVEGVVRLTKAQVNEHLAHDSAPYEYGGQKYRFQQLGSFLGAGPAVLPEQDVAVPVILIRAAEHSTALVADELIGSREIVVKSVGPQVAGIRGIAGATILGDGRIVIILDMGALVRSEWRARPAAELAGREREDRRVFALVVDDSITVRRVTQRLLERNGMRVLTARDGMDALTLLQEHTPDIILLDIEMPRMDGYEVAAHVRNDPRINDVPIVMITSRVGEKHRARAIELGVNDYLGKPYQESQLLDAIEPLVRARRSRIAAANTG
ncbi:MAG TPA: Hpt domain-containing protein [Steroidobacteraceae bacterium]|nr:Hpt domain-containing protein [Steroidobacteraceae bacterium]